MLIPDEDTQLVRDSVERLLAARDPVAERARLRATGAPFDATLWQDCVAMGLTGLLIAPEQGGTGLGVGGAVVVCEALGRALAPSPFLSSAVLGGMVLADADDGAQLAGLLAGDVMFAFCDPADQDRARLTPATDGWLLDGVFGFVADGGAATVFGVVADGPDGRAIALVPAAAAGVTVTSRRLVDERDGATIRFDGCVVAHASVVAGTAQGARDVARLCLAAEMLGLCDAALAITLDHVRQRRQFDRHIGSFQAVQHWIAHLHCDVELLRSAVRGGIEAAQRPDFAEAAALAKAKASRSGPIVINACLQLHGGVGMTDELAIGHYLKRAKVIARAFGDEDACLATLIA